MNFISRATGWLVLAIAFSTPALAQQAPAPAAAKAAPAVAPSEDPIKVQQQRSVDQPGNNAPVWREVRSGQPNYTSVPGREVGVLVQPQARFPGQDSMTTAGEAWRKFRNGPITFIGGWLSSPRNRILQPGACATGTGACTGARQGSAGERPDQGAAATHDRPAGQ